MPLPPRAPFALARRRQHAGVSTMTCGCSRTLKVRPATRARVGRWCARPAYRPSLMARALASTAAASSPRSCPAHQLADCRDHAGAERRFRRRRAPPAAGRERFRGAGRGRSAPSYRAPGQAIYLTGTSHTAAAARLLRGAAIPWSRAATAPADRYGGRLLECRAAAAATRHLIARGNGPIRHDRRGPARQRPRAIVAAASRRR